MGLGRMLKNHCKEYNNRDLPLFLREFQRLPRSYEGKGEERLGRQSEMAHRRANGWISVNFLPIGEKRAAFQNSRWSPLE
jgi:hypothetical protein